VRKARLEVKSEPSGAVPLPETLEWRKKKRLAPLCQPRFWLMVGRGSLGVPSKVGGTAWFRVVCRDRERSKSNSSSSELACRSRLVKCSRPEWLTSSFDILLATHGEDSYVRAMTVSHGRFGGFLLHRSALQRRISRGFTSGLARP